MVRYRLRTYLYYELYIMQCGDVTSLLPPSLIIFQYIYIYHSFIMFVCLASEHKPTCVVNSFGVYLYRQTQSWVTLFCSSVITYVRQTCINTI